MSPAPDGTTARPPRVLWLIKGLGPGGAESLLVSFARVAEASRAELHVAFVRPDKTQLVEVLESLGVRTHLLSAEPGGWLRALHRLIGDGNFDVVHAHAPLMAAVARVLVRGIRRSPRPLVVTTDHNEWGSYRGRTRILNGVTAPLDDHRWGVSRRVRASMWPWVRGGTEVLMQGIEFDRFQPAPDARSRVRDELGLGEDAVVAVTVANLRRPKDYPNLLRASRVAVDAVPTLYVLALGQGPLKEEIEQLHRELDLGNRVRFLGFRPDVPDVLAASDIFVIASAHEGGPLSLVEAMRAGLPAVATDVGFVSDAIRNGVHGFVVPPRSPVALAEALITLAGDRDLRQSMAATAYAASAQFDIRRAVERQLEVYAELAVGRLSSSRRG